MNYDLRQNNQLRNEREMKMGVIRVRNRNDKIVRGKVVTDTTTLEGIGHYIYTQIKLKMAAYEAECGIGNRERAIYLRGEINALNKIASKISRDRHAAKKRNQEDPP